MANHKKEAEKEYPTHIHHSESDNEEEEEVEDWDDWMDEDDADTGNQHSLLCLFCHTFYDSSTDLFQHCRLTHNFDFHGLRKFLGLDFYDSLRLINYVRSQVSENKCWSCEFTCQSNEELQNHLHETPDANKIKVLWSTDKFLKPFIENDSLLYSFDEDEEDENEYISSVNKEEIMKDLGNIEKICILDDGDSTAESSLQYSDSAEQNELGNVPSTSNCHWQMASPSNTTTANGTSNRAHVELSDEKPVDKHSKISRLNIIARDVKKVNENYFGSYSSFSIHREMISDKVRMDAYSQAILKNPSLMSNRVVMDVGCGTGILSLFAAQAGASRVIAIEASEKMATVASQIAKDNGLLRSNVQTEGNDQRSGVMEVFQGMVEDLEKNVQIETNSVDVLLSEWMGYCLLYESMLSSVLFARDKWLKPGGAILPDTATIYVAGFGRGATSIPFWEDVYGFNMSCVGKELVQDAAKFPVVDVVNESDLVTDAVILHDFDLATMKPDEVDFTSSIELKPKMNAVACSEEAKSGTTMCYGVVLWFDTGFTTRFCKETPAVLSTSPQTPKTHWSQTILTFHEPIAMAVGKLSANKSAEVGTDACPAARVLLRISIARAAEYRSIDISMETTAISADDEKRCWPVQMFNLS